MNRPQVDDYKVDKVSRYVTINEYVSYHKDLEKYCDDLEQEIDNLRRSQSLEAVLKLEKALDKTCKKLEEFSSLMYDEGVCFTPCIMQNEYWKKWAINEE